VKKEFIEAQSEIKVRGGEKGKIKETEMNALRDRTSTNENERNEKISAF